MKKHDPKVRFLEPSRPAEVERLEAKINAAVRKAKLATGPIRLFRHDDGSFGFTTELSAVPGKKKDIDALYDLVMKLLPVTRKGRRRSPVRKVQAKYMIAESLHRRIKERAREEEVSASELVERYLQEAV
jgi:hypothetical protein